MTAPRTGLSSPRARQLFDLLSDAAEGFQNSDVVEAAAVLTAQAVAHGAIDAPAAERFINEMAAAMIGDIKNNWPRVEANRRARRQ